MEEVGFLFATSAKEGAALGKVCGVLCSSVCLFVLRRGMRVSIILDFILCASSCISCMSDVLICFFVLKRV